MPRAVPTFLLALGLAALALAGAAPAAAQVPIPIPSGPPSSGPAPPQAAGVDVKPASSALATSLDQAGTVDLVVTNTGTPTGTPLDQARTIGLSVAEVPQGWHASIAPTELHLAPGQSGKATLTVSVTADAQGDATDVTVQARLYPLGVNAVPVAGSQVDPESTAAATVKATRSDSSTRDVLEAVGPYIWVILLGLVAAAVLVLSLLAANRRVAVRLSSPDPEQALPAGSRANFPLRVHNITRSPDTVYLRASPLPEGWNAYLPTPQIDLEPGQQEEVAVVLLSPKDAADGSRQIVDVTATSSLAPRRPATMRFEATVSAKRGK